MNSNTTHPKKITFLNSFPIFFLLLTILASSQNSFALPQNSIDHPTLPNDTTISEVKTDSAASFGKGIDTQNSIALPSLSNDTTESVAKTDLAVSFGKAIQLDGINDWINIPDFTLSDDFTIESWVKLAPGIDTEDALFGQEGSGSDINFYQGKARLFVNGDKVTANTALLPGTWGHIAISRSGSNLTLYVNGMKDAVGTWDGVLSLKSIGQGNRGFLKGMLDEIRVWNIARTESEISANFNSGVDPNATGLIGYWTFDNTGQVVIDASSSTNNGLLGANKAVSSDDPIQTESTAPFAKIRNHPFVVMQSLLFDENKPSNEKFISNFNISYLPEFGHGFAKNWDISGGKNPFYDSPKKELVEEWANNSTNTIGFIDIEHLPVTFSDNWDDDWVAKTPPVKITDTDRDRAIRELASIADWAHEANPKLIIGYFGILPQREYWSFIQPTKMHENLDKLQQRNKKFRALAEHVDVLFPSLYTFYDKPEEWKIYAKGMFEEARQYNKPTYAFIWPIYHSSNATLGDQFIAGAFWRLQLETIYKLGFDGVVIWGGDKKQWNVSALDTDPSNWWYQTLSFMHSKGLLPKNSTWKPQK